MPTAIPDETTCRIYNPETDTIPAVHACIIRRNPLNGHIEFLAPEREDGKGYELAPGGALEGCELNKRYDLNSRLHFAISREITEEFYVPAGKRFDEIPPTPNLPILGKVPVFLGERNSWVMLYVMIADQYLENRVNEKRAVSNEVLSSQWQPFGEWTLPNGGKIREIQVRYFAGPIRDIINSLMATQPNLF